MYMKRMIAIIFMVAILLVGCSEESSAFTEPSEPVESVVETTVMTEPPAVLAFLDELGYTSEEVDAMKTILLNVGINEVTELEIGPVSYGMQVIKGLAYTDGGLSTPKEVQIQINIENGVIYLVHIYCPSYGTSNQPTYLSGLDDRRADLYYDVEGGYVKKIDWEAKTVVEFEE